VSDLAEVIAFLALFTFYLIVIAMVFAVAVSPLVLLYLLLR
jgi:hypothetical protein